MEKLKPEGNDLINTSSCSIFKRPMIPLQTIMKLTCSGHWIMILNHACVPSTHSCNSFNFLSYCVTVAVAVAVGSQPPSLGPHPQQIHM
ncbi:hypothetical protein Lal_00034881 [Lupinus albus]|uniref:Uncharacterized protein n=1 Tax=Lupinus albus TaxID=3870 RepID=A0A6A4QSX9_LUPAL|nr:hypothetical protein Lalb_Chr03g0025641 [Lupinus albus]KAF1897178.1 hypothetical protein Lal_00034881 [Lupinus albus]